MKTSRVLIAMCCAVALVALYGCGGSSYLSEGPLGDEQLSAMTFSSSGIIAPGNGADMSKDDVFAPVTGAITYFYGNSSADEGVHSCYFDVVSTNPTLMPVEVSVGACADPNNCAVCSFTDGTLASPNCAVECEITAIPRDGLTATDLIVVYTDVFLIRTTTLSSSGGAVRIDIENTSALFDETSGGLTLLNPVDEGIVLDTPLLVDVQTGGKFAIAHEILNTIADADASLVSSLTESGFYAVYDGLHPLQDGDAWIQITADAIMPINLAALAVDGASYWPAVADFTSNGGIWHVQADMVDTLP